MDATTCNVWGCSSPVFDSRFSPYCKRHKEHAHHNGHPTFKMPALSKRYDTYDQELAIAYHSGKRWYKQSDVDLTHFDKSFGHLLDEAEQLTPLSQYRRLGDLQVRKQLLYLLRLSIERVGKQETMMQWLSVYLAATHRKHLFPNQKTLAVFVCRKSCSRRVSMPKHNTYKGNQRGYRLNANRALKMLEILEPILQLAFISANNQALWYRFYCIHLNNSNSKIEVFALKHESNPDYAKSLTRKRIIKSINRKYLGGI